MVIDEFENLIKEREYQIETLRKKGKKVIGYFCSRFPVELAYALDFIPIRIFVVNNLYESLGSEYIWERMCPYAKLIVGNFIAENAFYQKNVDIISGTIICQVVHRMLDILSAYTKKITLMLAYPLLRPPQKEQIEFFTSEINWLKRKLEKISQKQLTDSKLREAINLYSKIREELKNIHQLYADGKLVITYKDFIKLIQLSQFLDPFDFLNLIKKIKTKQIIQEISINKNINIIISGSIILPGNEVILDIVEESGGKIIGDDTCSGLRCFYGIDIKEPSILGIAQAYLNAVPCGAMQCMTYDKDERLKFLITLANRYKAHGIIYHTLRFCDPYSFKVNETQKFLQKSKNLAFLSIHTDVSFAETSRLKTRIEAFIESISFKKECSNADSRDFNGAL